MSESIREICAFCLRNIGDGEGECKATNGFHDQRECYQLEQRQKLEAKPAPRVILIDFPAFGYWRCHPYDVLALFWRCCVCHAVAEADAPSCEKCKHLRCDNERKNPEAS